MIELFHVPQTRSVRVYWLLEELSLPYKIHEVKFTHGRVDDPGYLKYSPLGKIPAIRDGDITIFESGAILEYILERYGEGRLAPAIGSAARATYLQWFHFGEATLLPPISDMAQHAVFKPEEQRIPAVAKDGKKRALEALAVIEEALSDRQHIAGDDFSAADIMVGYGIGLLKLFGLIGDDVPKTAAYLDRIQARPAAKKALAGLL